MKKLKRKRNKNKAAKAEVIQELALKAACVPSKEQAVILNSLSLTRLKAVVAMAIECFDNGCEAVRQELEGEIK